MISSVEFASWNCYALIYENNTCYDNGNDYDEDNGDDDDEHNDYDIDNISSMLVPLRNLYHLVP